MLSRNIITLIVAVLLLSIPSVGKNLTDLERFEKLIQEVPEEMANALTQMYERVNPENQREFLKELGKFTAEEVTQRFREGARRGIETGILSSLYISQSVFYEVYGKYSADFPIIGHNLDNPEVILAFDKKCWERKVVYKPKPPTPEEQAQMERMTASAKEKVNDKDGTCKPSTLSDEDLRVLNLEQSPNGYVLHAKDVKPAFLAAVKRHVASTDCPAGYPDEKSRAYYFYLNPETSSIESSVHLTTSGSKGKEMRATRVREFTLEME